MIFTEHNFPVTVLAPQADAYAADPDTDIVSLENHRHATFILQEGAGGTGTALVTMLANTSNTTVGATAIPFRVRVQQTLGTQAALTEVAATGYTTVAGANKLVAFEIDADEVESAVPGASWVFLNLTEVANDPCLASVCAILSNSRYGGADDVTVLS